MNHSPKLPLTAALPQVISIGASGLVRLCAGSSNAQDRSILRWHQGTALPFLNRIGLARKPTSIFWSDAFTKSYGQATDARIPLAAVAAQGPVTRNAGTVGAKLSSAGLNRIGLVCAGLCGRRTDDATGIGDASRPVESPARHMAETVARAFGAGSASNVNTAS